MQKRLQYAKLYQVQKLCGIIQQNNELFVEIKWRGWGDSKSKQPVSRMIQISAWREDIQRLLEDYQQTKMNNIVNIHKKTEQYIAEYKSDIFQQYQRIFIKIDGSFGLEDKPQNKIDAEEQKVQQKIDEEKKGAKVINFQESIQQKVRCKEAARCKLINSIKYGLRDLSPQDFFSISSLYNQCEAHLLYLIKSKTLPISDFQVQQIKGLIRNGNQYQFCVCFKQKVYACSLADMKNFYPRKLVYFLGEFLKYMKSHFGGEIQKQEQNVRKYLLLYKELNKIERLKILRLQQSYRSKIFLFGNNQHDAAINQTNYAAAQSHYSLLSQQDALDKSNHSQKQEKSIEKSPSKKGRKRKQLSIKSNECQQIAEGLIDNPLKELHDELMREIQIAGYQARDILENSQDSISSKISIEQLENSVESQIQPKETQQRNVYISANSSPQSKDQMKKTFVSKKQQKSQKSDRKSRQDRSLGNIRVKKNPYRKATQSNQTSKNSIADFESEQRSLQNFDCSTPHRSSQRIREKKIKASSMAASKDNLYSSQSFYSSDQIPLKKRKA